MAIDSAVKRLSALDHEEVWVESIPIPDGTVDIYDRYHGLWSYIGLVVYAKGTVVIGDAGVGSLSVVDAGVGSLSVVDS